MEARKGLFLLGFLLGFGRDAIVLLEWVVYVFEAFSRGSWRWKGFENWKWKCVVGMGFIELVNVGGCFCLCGELQWWKMCEQFDLSPQNHLQINIGKLSWVYFTWCMIYVRYMIWAPTTAKKINKHWELLTCVLKTSKILHLVLFIRKNRVFRFIM